MIANRARAIKLVGTRLPETMLSLSLNQSMNRSPNRRAARAFTLVEIMIVVAIIGVLLAIAIPGYRRAREHSQLTACLYNLKVYQDALDEYAFGHETFPSDLEELVTEKFLKKIHECPVGGAYAWSVGKGQLAYHLVCNGRHNASTNHVCIHEDQPPTAK